MAKYFAMIDGERCGPYSLEELHDAGVGPETYVWSKGMSDWQQAADVADICRHFRQRIFNRMHPSAGPEIKERGPASGGEKEREGEDELIGGWGRFLGAGQNLPLPEDAVDLSKQPPSLIPIAVMVIVFCFPLTGAVALYFSIAARKAWNEAIRSESKPERPLYTDQEREELKREAYDNTRSAKMWIGITFFMGFIFWAFIGGVLF